MMSANAGDDPLDLLDARLLRVDVVGDDAAAPHDDDAVHHLEHMVDVVRDEDAGVAGIARAAHEAQHPLRLGDAEIVGRLVEDDEVAVEIHGAGDRDRLALAAGERADRRLGRDVLADADLLQEVARDRVHPRLVHAVQEARPFDRLAAEEEVARDGELRDQRGILVDRLDPVRDRVGRGADRHLLAAHENVAARDRHGARQHLDQRRFSGAVVAEQADDLALVDDEGHVLQRLHAAVGLVDVRHADQFGHRLRSPPGAGARATNAAPSCRG